MFVSTPRDHETQTHRADVSPLKRKRTSRSFVAEEALQVHVDVTDTKASNSGLNTSVDSTITCSQDFNDRFDANMRFRMSNSQDEFGTQDSLPFSQVSMANPDLQLEIPSDNLQSPPYSHEDQWITIPAVAINPFLAGTHAGITSQRAPTKWMAPTRYMLEFDEEFVLGDGNFSKVVAARHRIDGLLYAIKKLHENVTSDASARRLTREVCAMAVLQGCPDIVRYHGSWIEDDRIYIQTELCAFGSLEVFVGRPEGAAIASLTRNCFGSTTIASVGKSLSVSSSNSFAESNRRVVDVGTSKLNQLISSSASRPESAMGPPPATPRDRITAFSSSVVAFPTVASNGPSNSSSDSKTAPTSYKVPQDLAWLILHSVAKALAYMHARDIAHMDIRPANIFIAVKDGPFHGVLSNFKSSRITASQVTRKSKSILEEIDMMSPSLGLGGGAGGGLLMTIDVGKANNNTSNRIPIRPRAHSFNTSAGASAAVAVVEPVPVNQNKVTGGNPSGHYLRSSSHIPVSTSSSSSSSSNASSLSLLNSQQSTAGSESEESQSHSANCEQTIAAKLLSGEYILKLGDFGHAISATHAQGRDLEEGENRYLARELLDLAHIPTDLSRADIFSLAASLYEICLGRPIAGDQGLWHRLRDGIIDPELIARSDYTPAFLDTIKSMLSSDPLFRPTANDLVKIAESNMTHRR